MEVLRFDPAGSSPGSYFLTTWKLAPWERLSGLIEVYLRSSGAESGSLTSRQYSLAGLMGAAPRTSQSPRASHRCMGCAGRAVVVEEPSRRGGPGGNAHSSLHGRPLCTPAGQARSLQRSVHVHRTWNASNGALQRATGAEDSTGSAAASRMTTVNVACWTQLSAR